MRELVFGARDPASLIGAHTAAADLSIDADLELKGVQLHYIVAESYADQVRASVPPSLHPTAPGLVSIHFWNVAESPAGAFTLAMVGVVVRTAFKPRHLIVSAFASSDAARRLLAPRCGFPIEVAEVEQSEYNDAVLSKISRAGQVILDISTHEPQIIMGSAAALKIAPLLSVGRVDGEAALIQCETSYEFKTTRRGKPKFHRFDAAALGIPAIEICSAVLSAQSTVDIDLHPLRFSLDLNQPAEEVRSTKLRVAA